MLAARLRFENAYTADRWDEARFAADRSSVAATGKMRNEAPLQSTGTLRHLCAFGPALWGARTAQTAGVQGHLGERAMTDPSFPFP
jgi:hypothetical protein